MGIFRIPSWLEISRTMDCLSSLDSIVVRCRSGVVLYQRIQSSKIQPTRMGQLISGLKWEYQQSLMSDQIWTSEDEFGSLIQNHSAHPNCMWGVVCPRWFTKVQVSSALLCTVSPGSIADILGWEEKRELARHPSYRILPVTPGEESSWGGPLANGDPQRHRGNPWAYPLRISGWLNPVSWASVFVESILGIPIGMILWWFSSGF